MQNWWTTRKLNFRLQRLLNWLLFCIHYFWFFLAFLFFGFLLLNSYSVNSATLFFPTLLNKLFDLIFDILKPFHLFLSQLHLCLVDIFCLNFFKNSLCLWSRCWTVAHSTVWRTHWIYESTNFTLPFHEKSSSFFWLWLLLLLFLLNFLNDFFFN